MGCKKLGLVLGAGSARGLAHIGVIQVLQEEAIPIDLVVGSSMGAVIGACYAAGTDMYLLPKLIAEMNFNQLIDMQIPRKGFIAGNRIQELIKILTHGKNFDQLSIPLAVLATDLEAGKRVVFQDGPVYQAVRASISIPGIFQPVELNNRLLIDGAVTERLPANTARELGAEVIIAVDVTFGNHEMKINSILDIFLQSISLLERQIHDSRIQEIDILIQPEVGNLGMKRFDLVEEAVQAGREATKPLLPLIKELLS
ncbi:MAG: patatin family protein [Syntrophomonadaceae bacterium]|nr:patatin family protein [Syntrophomonadaceae bacterium]